MGIPIRLHISLLIVVGLVSLALLNTGVGLPLILLGAVGIFGSVALHELGHSIVARSKGGYIHEIVLYFFGGAAKIANIPKRPKDEIMVALAGPAVSLILALICQPFAWLSYIALINWMLFFFNLLPVFPMDGGRVLRAILTIKKGRLNATRIAATVGKYFCILFVVIGLFGMEVPFFGRTLVIAPNLVLAFIGGYIYYAGKLEYTQVLLEHQASRFSGYRENHIDVEVSPPPYDAKKNGLGSMKEKIRKLFRL